MVSRLGELELVFFYYALRVHALHTGKLKGRVVSQKVGGLTVGFLEDISHLK